MEYQLIAPLLPQNNVSAVERVLTNRGIKLEDIPHFLNTTDEDIVNPLLLMNVEQGAKMLITHISQNDDMLLQIDSDADGYTSGAYFLNYLYSLFPNYVRSHVFYRIHTGKQHGIIPETVPENIKLVVAPDSSSNDYEAHAELKTRGVDVLVIDHHEADKVSENACIINNQLCDYPTKSLSGVGVVYKFCSYVDSLLNSSNAEAQLDLVAVGMVADMMDLRDYETRHLITKGLNNIRNPFVKGMVQTQNFSISKHGGLDPFAVSFYIAPQINATIRMGTQEEKMMLFESMLDYRGYEQIPSTKRGCKGQTETRVEQACRNCCNIKNRQTKARDTSLTTIEQIIEDKGLLNHKFLVVQLSPEHAADRNLTGLIANQLMAKYQRPVLLLNQVVNSETNEITWEGSGRGYDKSKFDNLREYLKQTDLVMYAEGHANALGVGVSDNNFNRLINRIDFDLEEFDFTPCTKVDIIFQGGNFNGSDIVDLAELKHVWGQGVEEPFIAIEHINVTKNNLTLMSKDKNPTLKITLPNGTSIIKFKSSEEEYEALCTEMGCVTINVVGKCERNVWNGSVTPQILVEDYEIVGSTQYYF